MTARAHQRARRAVLVLLAAVVVLGLWSGPASAHAVLESSSPASGERLDRSPERVRLQFDEPVGVDLGYVRLSRGGRAIEIGRPKQPSGQPDVVLADLPALRPGLYVIAYRVVSEDGHPVSGDVAFRVGAGAVPAAAASADLSPDRSIGVAYGLVRFLAYLALVVALGLPLVASVVRPSWWAQIRRPVAAAGLALSVAALAQVALAGPYLSGSGWGGAADPGRWADVVATPSGRWWIIRAVAAGVFSVAVLGATRQGRPRPALLGLVGALGGVVAWSFVADGHAATGRWAVAGQVATFGHLVAMAGWIAGLIVLLALANRLDGDLAAAVLRRWSPLAAGCVGVIVVTGVVQSLRTAEGWDLADSRYQQLILAKTAGVVVMLALAQFARWFLARVGEEGASASRLRLGVAAEFGVGIVILVLTTVLVQTPPVDGSGSPGTSASGGSTTEPTSAPRPSWSTTIEQGGRQLLIHIDGATVGRHTMHVVLDDRAAPLGKAVTAKARLLLPARSLGPFPVLLAPAGDRSWVASGMEITEPGAWRLEVLVDDSSSTIRFATDLPVRR